MHRALVALLLGTAVPLAGCPATAKAFKAITQPLLDFGGNDTGAGPASGLGAAPTSGGSSSAPASPSAASPAARPSPGTLLGTVAVGLSPRGLALDPEGRVWAAVKGSDIVVRLEGNAVSQRIGVGSPEDLAFDGSGRMWVATSAGVLGFDSSGAPLQGAAGQAAEAVVASGEFVYAAFPSEGVIRRHALTRQGLSAGVTLPGSAGTPRDLLVDKAGRLWAALGSANLVARYDAPAATPSAPVLIGSAGGDPSGLASDATGRLFVVGNGAIVEVRDGSARTLVQDSLLAGGRRMAIDPSGSLWVAANASNRLVRVTPEGKVAGGATGLAGPWDVVVDRHGDVWVSNESGGTVMRFAGS